MRHELKDRHVLIIVLHLADCVSKIKILATCYPVQYNLSSVTAFCGGLIALNVFYFREQLLKEKFMKT